MVLNSAISIPTHSPVEHVDPPFYQNLLNVATIAILALTLSLPYLIIAVLTQWKANNSSASQRSFALAWLIAGQAQGYAVSKVETLTGKKSSLRAMVIIFVAYGSNFLCGMVMVAEEMVEFGTCKAF